MACTGRNHVLIVMKVFFFPLFSWPLDHWVPVLAILRHMAKDKQRTAEGYASVCDLKALIYTPEAQVRCSGGNKNASRCCATRDSRDSLFKHFGVGQFRDHVISSKVVWIGPAAQACRAQSFRVAGCTWLRQLALSYSATTALIRTKLFSLLQQVAQDTRGLSRGFH